MKPVLLKYLRCTSCAGTLELEALEQHNVILTADEKTVILQTGRNISEYTSEIVSGVLSCRCGVAYPISGGIPRMYQGAEKDFPILHKDISTEKAKANQDEKKVQASFSQEWEELNYDDQTIWLWTVDQRIDTFCEEVGIASPKEITGKVMIDAGCGSGILSMNLSKRFQIEIIALDMAFIVNKAFQLNQSNLCHFVQTSVLAPPLAPAIADLTYSHGVLHHTYDTRKAFDAIAKLTKPGGMLYVWLYGKKKGWNRFRFVFIRSARTIISRLPKTPQTAMVYVMTFIHLSVRFVKRHLGMEKVQYKTLSQFLVSMRDKYTPIYAREHTEEEVKRWFIETKHTEVVRRTNWDKTHWWRGSTDLAIKGIRS